MQDYEYSGSRSLSTQFHIIMLRPLPHAQLFEIFRVCLLMAACSSSRCCGNAAAGVSRCKNGYQHDDVAAQQHNQAPMVHRLRQPLCEWHRQSRCHALRHSPAASIPQQAPSRPTRTIEGTGGEGKKAGSRRYTNAENDDRTCVVAVCPRRAQHGLHLCVRPRVARLPPPASGCCTGAAAV